MTRLYLDEMYAHVPEAYGKEFVEAMPDVRCRGQQIIMRNDVGFARIIDQHIKPTVMRVHAVDQILARPLTFMKSNCVVKSWFVILLGITTEM
ncbi:MAG: hypothetical protein ACYCY0_12265 [Acidithiobacillus ferrivorans]